MTNKNTYNIVGVMSGTSLDGLDIVLCQFTENEKTLNYKILKAETFSYPEEIENKLKTIHRADAESFCYFDRTYGQYTGKYINIFLKDVDIDIDAIACHGHTIFHNPAKGYSVQIGHGAAIAAETGIPVISDFRSLDVALGGQGAPLVPAGDKELFGEYDMCLNLGGFANISFEKDGERIAGDIAVCNYILNMLSQMEGKPFDKGGRIARSGKVIPGLLASLDHLPFYKKPFPKSLGREWVEQNILPMISEKSPSFDLLATFTTHTARQIASTIDKANGKNVLITGGGAYNDYLIELIKTHTSKKITIPKPEIIDYKEAIIFAWLGLKRLNGEANTLSTVTGAHKNSCGGTIYFNSKS